MLGLDAKHLSLLYTVSPSFIVVVNCGVLFSFGSKSKGCADVVAADAIDTNVSLYAAAVIYAD